MTDEPGSGATKKRRTSPTARTLAWYRHQDALPAVVEKWIAPFGGRLHGSRHDLFGFLDLIVLQRHQRGVTGVQACATKDISTRRKKMLEEPIRGRVERWLEAKNRLLIVGWSKKGPRGQEKMWTATVREVTIEDVRQTGRSTE